MQRPLEGGLKQLYIRQISQVFDGNIGTIKGCQAKQEGVQPRFHQAHPVPFAVKEAVAMELDSLEQEEIVEKVSASNWATPIVVVPKRDGSLRLCGDYRLSQSCD